MLKITKKKIKKMIKNKKKCYKCLVISCKETLAVYIISVYLQT